MPGIETQSWDRIVRYSQCQGRAVRAAALSQKWGRNVVQALQLPSDLLCPPSFEESEAWFIACSSAHAMNVKLLLINHLSGRFHSKDRALQKQDRSWWQHLRTFCCLSCNAATDSNEHREKPPFGKENS